MKSPRKSFAAFVFALAGLVAAQGGRIAFEAKDGSMKLGPFGAFTVRQNAQGIQFQGEGKGLVGSWKDIDIQAPSLGGTAKKVGKSFDLVNATATGGVTTTVKRATGTSVVVGNSMAYQAGPPETIKLDGALKVTNNEPSTARTFGLSGPAGLVTLKTVLKAKEIDTISVEGPVKLTFRQAAVGKKASASIDATGDHLSYTGGEGKGGVAVLRGNVHVEGDGDAYSGSSDADKVVVTFDKTGDVESVEMTGTPVRTLAKSRGGSGAR